MGGFNGWQMRFNTYILKEGEEGRGERKVNIKNKKNKIKIKEREKYKERIINEK